MASLHRLLDVAFVFCFFRDMASAAPTQYVYSTATAHSHSTAQGCNISRWVGTDALGMAGYPHAAKIECRKGEVFTSHGVASSGAFQVWLVEGELTFNGEKARMMGSSFWANEGAFVNMSVEGMAWVLGAPFALDENAQPNVFTASYDAPQTRKYDLHQAKLGLEHSSLHHDEHIMNGSSPSMDFAFGSRSGVDPPVVTVLNCANGSTPETNFVWSHFHPFGAVYIPMSGETCFSTDETICASPGEARWTSALLQYYEWFKKPLVASASANAVRDLAGHDAEICDRPIVFGVTNFDGSSPAGVPNFRDWPRRAHGQKSSVGIGPWGVFDSMTVRSTTVVTKTIRADSHGNGIVV
jgi:hypothetical protein